MFCIFFLGLGVANTISTTSWRDGQKLATKLLGPVPKLEQPNTQLLSSDRNEKDKSIKTGKLNLFGGGGRCVCFCEHFNASEKQLFTLCLIH